MTLRNIPYLLTKYGVLSVVTSVLLVLSVSMVLFDDVEGLESKDTKKSDKNTKKKTIKSKDIAKKSDKKDAKKKSNKDTKKKPDTKTKNTKKSSQKQNTLTKPKTGSKTVLFINPKVIDNLGQTVSKANPNQQVSLTAKISNFHNSQLSFWYRVTVEDQMGNEVSNSFVSGTLAAQQTFSPGISWMASKMGTYTINYYLEDSDRNWIAEPLSVQLTVGTIAERITSQPNPDPNAQTNTPVTPQSTLLTTNTADACPTVSDKPFTICNAHFEDSSENTLNSIQTGQQVYLVLTLQHHSSIAEDFVVGMSVDGDVHGTTKYVVGKAAPNRILKIKEPWIIPEPGEYTVNMFASAKIHDRILIANSDRFVTQVTGQLTTSDDWNTVGQNYPPNGIFDALSTFDSAENIDCGGRCYDPFIITTNVGKTVYWYNADHASHTFTSADIDFATSPPTESNVAAVFDSGLIMPGHGFAHKFDEPGSYAYFCIVHPWMRGMILVNP